MAVKISASGLDTFSNVDAALQDDGSFVVAWEGQHRGSLTQTIGGQTFTTDNAVLSTGVYLQRFDANGQPLAPPALLASEAGQSFDLTERGVSAAAASGGTLVAYLSAASSTASPQQIVVKAFDLVSGTSSTLTTISASASGLDTFSNVDAALQDDGSFVVTWEGQHRGSLTQTIGGQTFTTDNAVLSTGVYLQRFDANGQPLAPPALLASEAGQSFDLTERGVSAAAASGGTLVAYLSAASPTASPQQIVVRVDGALFTPGNDTVDFNALSSDQVTAVEHVSKLLDIYNSLSGNDIITLPDNAHAGNLTPSGAAPTTFILNDPAYTFHGGSGADTFDFTKDQGLNGYAAGDTLYIDGDMPASSATALTPYLTPTLDDTLKLPGSPSDYTFKVIYASTLAGTQTLVSRNTVTSAGPATPVNIKAANIERVTFANRNVTNAVTLNQNNLYAETARLCAEVYGPLINYSHGNEPLASDSGPGDDASVTNEAVAASTTQVGNRAVVRGWHEVSAMELALPPGSLDLAGFGTLRFSFANGFYQAIGNTALAVGSIGVTTEADALVLSGVVNGQKTLSVVFRGTDQLGDWGDYPSFLADHYAKFAPLVGALKAYLKGDPDSPQFDQILIGGHSLGAGVAQLFAGDLARSVPTLANKTLANKEKLFTFGSPGAEIDAGGVSQVNFFHTDDLVATTLSDASRALPTSIKGAATRAAAIAALDAVIGQVATTALVLQLQPKSRSGTDVSLNSDIYTGLLDTGFTEHAMGLDNKANVVGAGYVRDMDKLAAYANDKGGFFYGTLLGRTIRTGTAYAGSMPQIAIGNSSGAGGDMHVAAQDRYVLGDIGRYDVINWDGSGAGAHIRDIDGGGGRDTLSLSNIFGPWRWQLNNDHYDLYKIGLRDGNTYAGTFRRIDTVYSFPKFYPVKGDGGSTAAMADGSAKSATAAAQASFDPTSVATHLDGTLTTVQQAAPGVTTLAADGVSDVTYAGSGVAALQSSAAHAVLVYGLDTAAVTVSAGSATIASDGSTGGTVYIDTGGTASVVIGGARTQAIAGHLAGATFEGGSGDSTVSYGGPAANYTLTSQADGSTLVSGTAPGGAGDRLIGVQHVAFTDVTMDLTTALPADPTPSFLMTDTTANISSVSGGEDYSGPVSYLQKQFVYAGQDAIALAAVTPNAFLHGGAADDALNASSGSNVLDGGLGSSFLVGTDGTDGGTDTFYVDGRGTGITWSTVVNFHHGDAVTFWGFIDGISSMPWTAQEGAQGYQGATIHSELAGAGTGVNASLTFAGVSLAESQSKFTTSTGSVDGNSYLNIVYTG